MKTHILVLFLLCFMMSIQAQKDDSYKVVSSNLGSSGSSKIITTGKGKYYVSHSIGQGSIIGTSSKSGYSLVQGYQQAVNKIKVDKSFDGVNDLSAAVYPNPFEQSISISFTEIIENNITVQVFNVSGKLIYTKMFKPAQNITLHLDAISSGTYLLKTLSNNKLFSAKILKI